MLERTGAPASRTRFARLATRVRGSTRFWPSSVLVEASPSCLPSIWPTHVLNTPTAASLRSSSATESPTMKTSDITNLVSKTTKKWAKQRKAEERSSRAASRRRHMYSDRVCATDVAHEILPGAYAHAAGPTGLHVSQRQLFYAARNQFLEETGRELDFKYFTAKILRKYLQRSDTQHWKITRDPRGNLREPHTDRTIPLGTLLVDDYLAKLGWSEEEKPEGLQILLPTTGPENRY